MVLVEGTWKDYVGGQKMTAMRVVRVINLNRKNFKLAEIFAGGEWGEPLGRSKSTVISLLHFIDILPMSNE